jgi:DNA-binding beta-propeller fold protein YncE
MLVLALAGCGADQGASGRGTTVQERDASEQTAIGQERGVAERDTTEPAYTPPKNLLPPPEPAKAPPLEEKPVGQVIELSSEPEGIVADPETGLVAVGLRDPDKLALIDGDSGEVVRRVDLPGSARHLNIAAPGGPVLVPGEPSDSLIQVSLPDGEVVETPVDNFPHDAASTPEGRIFVISEAASTATIIEGRRVIERIKTPLNPGGVATTEDGLVGIVGVRGLALEIFEADTLDSLGIIDAGEGPTHVKAGPDNRFYVADTRGDAIVVVRTRPLTVLRRLALPDSAPYGLAFDERRHELWVTSTARNRVVLIRGARRVRSFPTVRQPNSVAVDTRTGRVFVAGRYGELQLIDPPLDAP